MDFWAYILRCADESYYVGHTDKGDERLSEHELGMGSSYTRKRRPRDIGMVGPVRHARRTQAKRLVPREERSVD